MIINIAFPGAPERVDYFSNNGIDHTVVWQKTRETRVRSVGELITRFAFAVGQSICRKSRAGNSKDRFPLVRILTLMGG